MIQTYFTVIIGIGNICLWIEFFYITRKVNVSIKVNNISCDRNFARCALSKIFGKYTFCEIIYIFFLNELMAQIIIIRVKYVLIFGSFLNKLN